MIHMKPWIFGFVTDQILLHSECPATWYKLFVLDSGVAKDLQKVIEQSQMNLLKQQFAMVCCKKKLVIKGIRSR